MPEPSNSLKGIETSSNIARRAVPAPAFVKSDTFIVDLRNAQGLTNIKRTVNADMEAFLCMKWQPAAMGVILDADTDPPANRFADFATFLHSKGYPNPVNLDIAARSNGLRAGVFAFPWLEWIDKKGEHPKDPDAAFIGFCRKKTVKA